ncbi:hypothetical protein ACQ4LK_21635, partial [Bacillus pumilus]
DEKAPKGTCYVETSFGKVEASVDTQMNQLKGKLLEVIDSGCLLYTSPAHETLYMIWYSVLCL